MSMKITLEGVQDAVKRIQDKQKSLMDASDEATKKGAFFIEREAKLNCPVDTGRLRASIHTEVIKPNEFEVADLVDYGLIVEFKHPTKSGFFRKAAELAKKEYPTLMISEVKKATRS